MLAVVKWKQAKQVCGCWRLMPGGVWAISTQTLARAATLWRAFVWRWSQYPRRECMPIIVSWRCLTDARWRLRGVRRHGSWGDCCPDKFQAKAWKKIPARMKSKYRNAYRYLGKSSSNKSKSRRNRESADRLPGKLAASWESRWLRAAVSAAQKLCALPCAGDNYCRDCIWSLAATYAA